DYRQRDGFLIPDPAFIAPAKPDRRRKADLCFRISLDIDLRRNTRITRIAPVGFPARLQFDLQDTASFLAGRVARATVFENDAHTPAGRLGPAGSCCQRWKCERRQ